MGPAKHEKPFLLKNERITNVFLKSSEQSVSSKDKLQGRKAFIICSGLW